MQKHSTAVLVVGGSLVGLASALFLGWHGVPVIVVERHRGSSPHPRAMGYTTRTMELLRGVGLGERIPQIPADFRLRRMRVESLAGAWHTESAWTPPSKQNAAPPPDVSPCTGAAIAQDAMEPILRARAVELGADVRQATELVSFTQDDGGVTAVVCPRDGEAYEIRAKYLIGADGGKSAIRGALGIGVTGRGHMRTIRSVLFRAPLDAYLERGVVQFEVEQPGFKAFLTTYHDGRWVLMFDDDVERNESELRAAISKAIGRDDVPVEIITTGRWDLGAIVADRFSVDRVFLAGDAAHCFPPTRGGYGANTGIHDAHNLAWKLALVLGAKARPELLGTYDAERRPAAWVRHQQIFARPDYAREGNGIADGEPIRDDLAMELGQLYRSSAILGAGPELPVAARPGEWNGQPGTRAPHVWIARDGKRISTLDLFTRDFALVSADAAWSDAATRMKRVRVASVVLGREEASAFGVGEHGASLVRPDGYVAWRTTEELEGDGERETALAKALAEVAALQ